MVQYSKHLKDTNKMNKFIKVNESSNPIIINVKHIIKYYSLKGKNNYSVIILAGGNGETTTDSTAEITRKIGSTTHPQINKYLTIDNKQLRIKNKRLYKENNLLRAQK